MIIIRILRFVVIGILVYFLFKILMGSKSNLFSRKKRKQDSPGYLEEMKKDPVCGTYIPESQAIKMNHSGEWAYFCSKKCRDKFKKIHS